MKKVLIFLCLGVSFFANAQKETVTDKMTVKQEMKLKNFRITDFTNDVNFSNPSDLKVPTQLAVKRYVDNMSTSVFNVVKFGIIPDNGVTDYTTLYRNLLDTVTAKGGGEIFFPPGVYRMNGKITYPVTYPLGVGTTPRQVNLRIKGSASHRTGNSQADSNYGTVILLGYNSSSPSTTDTLCRWCFKGSGNVEIEGITFRSADAVVYNTSFFHFTLTSSQIHHCAFVGSPYAYSNNKDRREDVIEYGGKSYTEVLNTSDTAAFQGYGTTLQNCMFNRVQSAAVFNSLANAITCSENWFSHHCGGLAPFRDRPGVQVAGNNFLNNSIEMVSYRHGFKFHSLSKGTFIGNTLYDHTTGQALSDYWFEQNSSYHNLVPGYSQAPNSSVKMVDGSKRDYLNFYTLEANDTTKLQSSLKLDADSRMYLRQNSPYVYNNSGDYVTSSIGNSPNIDYTFLKKASAGSEIGLLTFRDLGSNGTLIYSPNAAVTGGTTYLDAYNLRLRPTNELWFQNSAYMIGSTFYSNVTDAFRSKQGAKLWWTDGSSPGSALSVGLTSTSAGVIKVVDSGGSNANLETGGITITNRTGTVTKLLGTTSASVAADVTIGSGLDLTAGVLTAVNNNTEGTYNPSVTSVTSGYTISAFTARYQRVGNTVTVNASFTINQSSGDFGFSLSLPIAPTKTSFYVVPVGIVSAKDGDGIVIENNNIVNCQVKANSTTSNVLYSVIFSYTIQ